MKTEERICERGPQIWDPLYQEPAPEKEKKKTIYKILDWFFIIVLGVFLGALTVLVLLTTKG